jgi:hypothetical protein
MNATHIKPLFHEKTLNRAMKGFTFPADLEARCQVIQPWIDTLHSGVLDLVKEVSLHGKFLESVFGQILGYTNVIEGVGKVWTLHAETTISHGGGSADGAIGFFSAAESVRGAVHLKGHIVAPIELKGAGNNLDRPASPRRQAVSRRSRSSVSARCIGSTRSRSRTAAPRRRSSKPASRIS